MKQTCRCQPRQRVVANPLCTLHPMSAGGVPEQGGLLRDPETYCRRRPRAWRRCSLFAMLLAAAAGCAGERAQSIRQRAEALIPSTSPELVPTMLNETTPFSYPPSAWEQRIQGNVVLRLHVDANGQAVRDSTTVARTSGVPALDSAAVAGSVKLRFRPARRDGIATGLSLLFPVHYRHPDGPPFPGDSLR